MSSIRKHIPNTLTSMNLLCGSLGVVAATQGHCQAAFLLMIGGAVFDFFDGFVARLLGVSSPMGKELDSIADTVSFGLLPAIMLSLVLSTRYGSGDPLCWFPMLIAVFSGLRLAKFNVDTRQTSSFLGLPTPACAMICGSLAYFVTDACLKVAGGASESELCCKIASILSDKAFIIALSAVLCALLVSEIPMFSLKMHRGEGIGAPRIVFAATALASLIFVAATSLSWSMAALITFTAYILINLGKDIWQRRERIRRH